MEVKMKYFIRNLVRRVVGIPTLRKYSSLKIGKSVTLDPNLQINAGNIIIGDYTYIGPGRISGLLGSTITICKFTSIAANIQIIGALHNSYITNYNFSRLLPLEERKNHSDGISRGDIVIGNDVWIGINVIILSGITIGDGAIVGAGAVVTKDIPPYAIAVGVPAKVIKYRFSDEEIQLLLNAKWWDWEFSKIKRKIPMFYNPSISVRQFLEDEKEPL